MANYTSRFNLEKPLSSERYDVEVYNRNMDKLEAALVKYTDDGKGPINYDSFQNIPNDISINQRIVTRGFEVEGDGGGAGYLITGTPTAWTIPLGQGLYASITETEKVNYKMFGASLDGVHSDFEAMQRAHEYGNANKVPVINNFGVIYKDVQNAIVVKHDVDLRGSTILIDNTNFYAWFEIRNDNETLYTYTTRVDKSELRTNTSYFTMDDNSLPRNSVLHLKDNNVWAVRYDGELVYDEFRGELMFHSVDGLCLGPLVYGYDGADTDLQVQYTRYNSRQLTFRGCQVNVNTTPNVNNNFLVCRRHNTAISDFTFDPPQNSMPNKSFKGSLITIRDSYNVRIENINGNNIAGKKTSTGVTSSGYVVRIMNSFKIVMESCNLNGYWGSTASTCVKDWTVRDCQLNRIDVHNYFRDITIDNCKLYDWGINLGYGRGLVTVKNTVFINYKRPDTGGRALLNINNTYGQVFSGTMHLANIQVIKADFDVSLVKIVFIEGENTPRDVLKLPNIIATDVEVLDYESSLSAFNIHFKVGTTSNVFELADYISLHNINYRRVDNSKGKITFMRDLTNGTMYAPGIKTSVKVTNVDFSGDATLGEILPTNSKETVRINNGYDMEVELITGTTRGNRDDIEIISPSTGGTPAVRGFTLKDRDEVTQSMFGMVSTNNEFKYSFIGKSYLDNHIAFSSNGIAFNKPIETNPWINVPHSPNWTGNIRYRKNAIGQLELSILNLKSNNLTASSIIATLPIEFRPISSKIIALYNSSTEALGTPFALLTPEGDLVLRGGDLLPDNNYHANEIIVI